MLFTYCPNIKAALLLLLSINLVACKGEIKQITFSAPLGTSLEYTLEPAGGGGQVTIASSDLNGYGEQTISVGKEIENLIITASHPQAQSIGSPHLRVELTSGGSGKDFVPSITKTSLAYNRDGANLRETNCKNLINAAGSGGMVRIAIQPVYSVGDCDEQDLRYNDPLWAGKPRGIGEGTNYFSPSDDASMGRQFVNEFNAKNSHLLMNDSVALPYLQNLMDRIAANSDSPQIKPKVFLINADVINAFALPGGYVYVFRGILEYMKDENELVGVLGHEWAHVAGRHGTRNMTSAINWQIAKITTILILEAAKYKQEDTASKQARRTLIATLLQVVVYVGGDAMILAGGRDAEREADTLGAQYAYRVGYAPNGIGSFFQALSDRGSGKSFWLDSLFSSHPAHDERVSNNKQKIANYFPSNSMNLPVNTQSFAGVKLALRDFPPMLSGPEANKVLSLQFVKSAQDVSFKNMESVLGKKFGAY